MNKIVTALLIIVGVGVAVYFVSSSNSGGGESQKNTLFGGRGNGDSNGGQSADVFQGVQEEGDSADDESSNSLQDRPATEVYRNADEALAAVKGGAGNYDDIVLEQFTDLGPDCNWCDQFYKSVKDLMNNADTPPDQKSYYAELLAISGRVDNVSTLVDSIENGQAGQDPQIMMEALELTVGKDDVVNYLGGKLGSSQNTALKESIVAAISNQGSPLAINTLYKNAVETSNPDGYYSEGTGLGEVIPDESSFGVLKEIINKKDDYSHLAVKSLLNAGSEGLKSLFDTLSTSTNVEQDRKILKDAVDHINFDEDSEKFLKDIAQKSQNPALVELANATLQSFAQDADTTEDVGAEEDTAVSSPLGNE